MLLYSPACEMLQYGEHCASCSGHAESNQAGRSATTGCAWCAFNVGALVCRYLVEAPANVCTPRHLAAAAAHIQALNPDRFKLKVTASSTEAATPSAPANNQPSTPNVLSTALPVSCMLPNTADTWLKPAQPSVVAIVVCVTNHALSQRMVVGCVCVQVLEEGDCKKLGMGLFLGVAQGSDEPLRFIHLTYTPEGPVTHKARAGSARADMSCVWHPATMLRTVAPYNCVRALAA
jgi:hypothetical protein